MNDKRLFLLLCMTAFLASLNQNIYAPIIPLLRDTFHVSLSAVNATVSYFIGLTAILQLICGPLVDRFGPRIVLLVSLLITTVSSVGCALTTQFTFFFICRLLQAVGTAAIPLIVAAMIGHLFHDEQRNAALGTYQTVLSIAPAIAPLLGGWIGEAYGHEGIFVILTSGSLLFLTGHLITFPSVQLATQGRASFTSLLRQRMIISCLALCFTLFCIYFAILVYLPVLLADTYHFQLTTIGLLYLPLSASLIIGSIVYKKVFHWRYFTLILHAGLISSVTLFAVSHSSSLVGLVISLTLFGIGLGSATPLYASWILAAASGQKASAMGLYNFVRYVGMAVGPLIISSNIPMTALFGLCSIVLACTTIPIRQQLWLK